MEHSTGVVLTRCTHCGGSLRPGAPWCTLCLTKTAADPEPTPEPTLEVTLEPTPGPEPAARLDPLTAPLDQLVTAPAVAQLDAAGPAADPAAGWPCTTCESVNPLAASTCAACGVGFLEVVRLTEPPLLALPGVGDLARLSKPALIGLAFAVAAVAVLLTLLVGVLLS